MGIETRCWLLFGDGGWPTVDVIVQSCATQLWRPKDGVLQRGQGEKMCPAKQWEAVEVADLETKRWPLRFEEVIFGPPFLMFHAGLSGCSGRSDVSIFNQLENQIQHEGCWATFQSHHHFLALSIVSDDVRIAAVVFADIRFLFPEAWISRAGDQISVHGWWKSLVWVADVFCFKLKSMA